MLWNKCGPQFYDREQMLVPRYHQLRTTVLKLATRAHGLKRNPKQNKGQSNVWLNQELHQKDLAACSLDRVTAANLITTKHTRVFLLITRRCSPISGWDSRRKMAANLTRLSQGRTRCRLIIYAMSLEQHKTTATTMTRNSVTNGPDTAETQKAS